MWDDEVVISIQVSFSRSANITQQAVSYWQQLACFVRIRTIFTYPTVRIRTAIVRNRSTAAHSFPRSGIALNPGNDGLERDARTESLGVRVHLLMVEVSSTTLALIALFCGFWFAFAAWATVAGLQRRNSAGASLSRSDRCEALLGASPAVPIAILPGAGDGD